MLKSILLHIGSPKCGSTYLQRVLIENRDRLAAAGIAYPHDGGQHPGNAAEIQGLSEAALDRLAGPAGTLVLSHEDLFSQPGRADALAKIVAERGIAVHVLVFLRPFSGFVYGDYSQFLKQHYPRYIETRAPHEGRSFEEFAVFRSRVLNVAGWLKAWAKRFPGQTMTIASPRDIRRVTEPLLCPDLHWTVARDQANPSLRMEDCDRIAAALRDPAVPGPQIRDMLRDALLRTGEPDAGRTAERTAWIEAIFGKQNEDILDVFGYDNRVRPDGAVPAPVIRTTCSRRRRPQPRLSRSRTGRG